MEYYDYNCCSAGDWGCDGAFTRGAQGESSRGRVDEERMSSFESSQVLKFLLKLRVLLSKCCTTFLQVFTFYFILFQLRSVCQISNTNPNKKTTQITSFFFFFF